MNWKAIGRSRRFRLGAGASVLAIVLAAFALPRLLPSVLAAYRGDLVFRVPPVDDGPTLYLTIDDGPSPATDEILRVLAKHRVPATFFITGSHVHAPAQLTAITAAGHDLGHHLQTTRACSRLSQEDFQRDFDQVDRVLAAAGGAHLFRPPSDFGTREQIAYAVSRGYRPVVGTVFPLDHWVEHPGRIRRLVRWLAIDGGIIILHDGATRGPRTAEVLDRLLPELQAAGYHFGRLATALPRPASSPAVP